MNAFIQELFHVGIYKRSQGRVSRQVTFAAMAIIAALGFWMLQQSLLVTMNRGVVYGICFPGLLLCWWIAYRIVNVPVFADFLIAVEAEMNKVSWPTRLELMRGSVVVLVTIISLSAALFMFDAIWRIIFHWMGVV